MTARQFTIAGHVQGVGFRYFVQGFARTLGLDGFAQNLPDGNVLVCVRGPEAALAKLEAQLRQGPSRAHVRSVQVAECTDSLQAGFEVR